MMNKATNRFDPDYVVHPGEILEETLQARGIKKVELAKRCGLSVKTVSQIINKKEPVTPETAIKFERVLGVSAAVWNNLEALYRLRMARVSARRNLEKHVSWARCFPIKALVNRGMMEQPKSPVDTVEKLLSFLGVGSMETWEDRFGKMIVAYRSSPSFQGAPESVATWLRIGELLAQDIDTAPYDQKRFRSALRRIRKLTSKEPEIFEPEMKQLCCRAGVALTFVSELPGTHLSGATRWLNKDKALIMLSLRHKSDDHFWFSFFHEAAHIVCHGKKKVFLDEREMEINRTEEEANRFATNALIPPDKYTVLIGHGKYYKDDIIEFAKSISIAPGIVVGRLQHDGRISYKWHNDLKCRFDLIE